MNTATSSELNKIFDTSARPPVDGVVFDVTWLTKGNAVVYFCALVFILQITIQMMGKE